MKKILKLLLAAALCFAAAAQAEPKVGQPVAAFDTVLLDGKKLTAAELEGKAVLVVFWATWCTVCQRELPELQRLHDKYRSRGFEILNLSIDVDRFVVEEFWKDHEYRMPVAMRAPQHSQVFGVVRGTPTLYLLDGKGVLRLARVGALPVAQLEAQILPLLPR